jgi:hypothetical protein
MSRTFLEENLTWRADPVLYLMLLRMCVCRWGYVKKKIPAGQARVVFAEGNFWGRTLAAISR